MNLPKPDHPGDAGPAVPRSQSPQPRPDESAAQRDELVARINELTGERKRLIAANARLMRELGELHRVNIAAVLPHRDVLPVSDDDDTAPRHRLLPDAPLSLEDAAQQAADLRLVNWRLFARYYGRRLVVIAGLEETGTAPLEICVREMLRVTRGVEHNVGIQKTLHAGPFTHVDALYPEILLYVRDGGVLCSYLAPSPTNAMLLHSFRCRYVVLLRHPADRLVARYCGLPGTAFRKRFRIDAGFLFRNVFERGLPREDELESMIVDGYLLDNLTWMANWLRQRHPRMSAVVRYEDLVGDADALLGRLHRFLFRAEPAPALRASLSRYVAEYRDRDQPESAIERRDPRGHSGKVGVRMEYFSPRNVASYNRVIDGFMATHPSAALVAACYPDLRIAPG
jgi:hypothetical protein